MIPPCKADKLNLLDFKLDNKYRIEELHDGTMINLFYHNNEWLMSTRSDIGCKNRWNNKKSFKCMFDECIQLDYNTLNKNYCYSFVMKHKDNRNISIIETNCVILVEVYDMTTLQPMKIPNMIPNIKTTDLNDTINKLNVEYFNTFSWKGITIKQNGKRYNYINELYSQVESLSINTNNPLYNYVSLYKQSKIKDYLRFYPEYTELYKKYETGINKLIIDLHDQYKSIYIYKTIDHSNCVFQLKPLIRQVHKLYKTSGVNTTKNRITNFIFNLPQEQLVFVLKYYL